MIEIINTEPTLWDKIRMIAEYYSKYSQSKKLLEEMVELDMTIMSIVIEATALVLSGDLDEIKEKK